MKVNTGRKEAGGPEWCVAMSIAVIPSFLTLLFLCPAVYPFIVLGRQPGPTLVTVEFTNEDIRVAAALVFKSPPLTYASGYRILRRITCTDAGFYGSRYVMR